MKKLIIIFSIFLVVGFGFSVGYYMYNSIEFEMKKEIEESKIDSENNNINSKNVELFNAAIETSSNKNKKLMQNEIENTISKQKYILKELDGLIAVYSINANDEEILEKKTGIAIRYLPDEDIKKIKNGIMANGEEELNEILEDYE